jgi:heme exporter protein A
VLQLVRVAKTYGVKVIFKDVSCAFAPASVSLLVGGNGAGKSTLMRVMAGLSRPSAGEARLAEHVRVGYLGHATFLYPGLTALENLAFWRDACGLAFSRKDLMTALERVGLEAHAQERAGVFSRGMAQRLNLARILMQEPNLLLLDEPGTGLDASSLALLRREVMEARSREACVILISHDLAGDAPLADRLLALDGRRLAYDGPPAGYRPAGATSASDAAPDSASDSAPDDSANNGADNTADNGAANAAAALAHDASENPPDSAHEGRHGSGQASRNECGQGKVRSGEHSGTDGDTPQGGPQCCA